MRVTRAFSRDVTGVRSLSPAWRARPVRREAAQLGPSRQDPPRRVRGAARDRRYRIGPSRQGAPPGRCAGRCRP